MVVKRVGSKNVDLNRSVLLEMKQVNYVGAEGSETEFRIPPDSVFRGLISSSPCAGRCTAATPLSNQE